MARTFASPCTLGEAISSSASLRVAANPSAEVSAWSHGPLPTDFPATAACTPAMPGSSRATCALKVATLLWLWRYDQ